MSTTSSRASRLLNSGHSQPVNIGNPSEMTVLQFAEEIIRLIGAGRRSLERELPEDDPKVRQPDISPGP
jgi:dTDP-glucose 4,6-dehydratase